MAESGNILQDVRMLVTDVDGTLLGRRPEFDQYRQFRLRIDQIRTVYSTAWVVCTGRSRSSLQSVFRPLRAFGIAPDYLITQHAFIFERRGRRFVPHVLWNLGVILLLARHTRQVSRAIPRLRRAIFERVPFPKVLHRSSHRICFRFYDEETAGFAADILREEVRPYRYLRIFPHLREVDVRAVPFTKGMAVAELGRHLGIHPAHVLVIGDGHNDISMMEVNIGCRTACPVNAAPEVVETVHRTGGHIASKPSMAGVMEILDAYEQGAVRSELPERWVPTSERLNPFPPSNRFTRRESITGVLLFLAVLYTTLAALASFDLVPFSGLILKPYLKILRLVETVVYKLFLH
jgi:hydroxymethylpyrimidine pyrophosphatase-like HAD family hydrolase